MTVSYHNRTAPATTITAKLRPGRMTRARCTPISDCVISYSIASYCANCKGYSLPFWISASHHFARKCRHLRVVHCKPPFHRAHRFCRATANDATMIIDITPVIMQSSTIGRMWQQSSNRIAIGANTLPSAKYTNRVFTVFCACMFILLVLCR